MSEIDEQQHGHGHGHGHGHDHEHGAAARWLGKQYARVTHRDGERLNRVQALGVKVAAGTLRAAAFVVCPGDDIAAAALPVVHGFTGDADHGHQEHQAILPRRTEVAVRLPLDRSGGEPGPDPDGPPDLPVPPTDPAAYDLESVYQRFVLEGVAAPGSAAPGGPTASPPPTPRPTEPDRGQAQDR